LRNDGNINFDKISEKVIGVFDLDFNKKGPI